MCVRPLRTVESLQASLLMRNSPDYNTRGLHNMGQASVNLSHNPAWFHRKAIQEFRVQLTCTKESTMLIKGSASQPFNPAAPPPARTQSTRRCCPRRSACRRQST